MRTLRYALLILVCGMSVVSAGTTHSGYDLSALYNTMATPPAPVLTGTTPISPSNYGSPYVNGTASPGATVEIFKSNVCGGAPVATTIADGGGNFSAMVTVSANTTTTFTANATDITGTSPCSNAITYVYDATLVATPVVTGTTPPSPSNNSSPTVQGTAEVNSTVTIYLNGVCSGSPAASGVAAGGTFSIPISVPPNAITTIAATATVSGNTSTCSVPITYVHDGIPPATPVLTGTTPPSPSNNPSPTVQGTAAVNSTVKIYLNGDCSGSPAASGVAASGTFSLGVTVPLNATTTITATATDLAGNTSTCSAPMLYRHDNLPPSVPVFTGTSPASPANNNDPYLLGTAEAGSLVSIYTDNACTNPLIAAGYADGGGLFSIQVNVANNSTTTFYAHATDSVGNTSNCTPNGITYQENSNLPTGSICGFKYHDLNGNGIYEPGSGETPLAGWTILAISSQGDTLATQTDVTGNYCFPNVTDSLYKVMELGQAGYIQTGGEPYYTLLMAGALIDNVNFGNFKSGSIYGVKFSDLDSNGVNDGEPGLADWPICLTSKSIPNPNIDFSNATGTFSMQLDVLPNTTISAATTGYLADRRGTFDQPLNLIPTEMLSLNLTSAAPITIGGDQATVEVMLGSGRQPGGIQGDGSNPANSFFDVFVEIDIASVGPGGGCYVAHAPLHLSGLTNSVPFPAGTQWSGGNIQLFDETTGQPVGTLDAFNLILGAPVSASTPICTTTDTLGAYCFMQLLPGTYNVHEAAQSCWEQTTADPPAMTILSGDSLTGVDFGNHQRGTRLCIDKYYDENHNQILDAGEQPMEGVEFVLTGANPSNVFSAFTDANGRACFSDVPTDDYVLTENVPGGYAVSSPKSGSMNFQITECHDTTVMWLNTAAFTDSLFRTATVEQWALSPDLKGKRKSIKCKPDKVDFKINLVWKLDRLRLKFPMFTRGQVRIGKDKQGTPIATWDSLKTVEVTLPGVDTAQVIQIDGRGFKGKPISLNYEWVAGVSVVAKGKLPGTKTVDTRDSLKANILRLPMPNLHNVGEDLERQSMFPVVIGAPTGIGSILHPKYRDVQKSFIKIDHGIPIFHTDSTRCLDLIKGKPIKKQVKTYPPDIFGGNKLFAEVLALRLNILASQTGKFPPGLDTLIYNDPNEPNFPLNGHSVGEIYRQADSILICGTNPKNLGLAPVDYYRIVHRINEAFGSSAVDTVSWSCSKLILTGVKSLKSVPWLYANHGAIHNVTVQVLPPAPEPSVFVLSQNYPNPFNPVTTIQFELLEPAMVSLKIYNTLGQEVASLLDEQLMDEGTEEVEFDASRLPSGVYFYRIIAQGIGDEEEGVVGKRYVDVKKMLLLK